MMKSLSGFFRALAQTGLANPRAIRLIDRPEDRLLPTKPILPNGASIMRPLTITLLFSCLLGLAACENTTTTTYPLSGQPCSPSDPVQGMSATDCLPPV